MTLYKVTVVRMAVQTLDVVVDLPEMEAEDFDNEMYAKAWDIAGDQEEGWVSKDFEAQDEPCDYIEITFPKKTDIPKPGDIIWVDSSFYISHGEDDVCGGMAEIEKVRMPMNAGEDTPFVYVKEHPGLGYNWHSLAEEQEELAKTYGSKRARPCPHR